MNPLLRHGGENRTWTLRLCVKPPEKPGGAPPHRFLALADETDPRAPVILDELHFVPRNGRGEAFTGARARVCGLLNAGAQALGLQDAFRRAARKLGREDGIFYLRAVAYAAPGRDLRALPSEIRARATPRAVLSLWNDACRVALAVNGMDRLFVSARLRGRGGDNCAAGAETALEKIGLAFADASRRPALSEALGDFTPANDAGKPLEQLAAENAALKKRLRGGGGPRRRARRALGGGP